jgi:hypothetical protein
MLLEQLDRAPQSDQGGVELRLADEMDLGQELEGIADVLARGFERPGPQRAATALQSAASFGARAPVHHAAPLGRRTTNRLPPPGGASVQAAAAVGKEAGGGHRP